MKRSVVAVLVGVGILGFTVLPATIVGGEKGKDKKGPNIQDPPKDAKLSESTKALQDLELAARLIQYGRKNKNGNSLLLAAQILHKTNTMPLKVPHTSEGGTESVKTPKVDNSPKALITEAKKLGAVEGMITATQKIIDEDTRGAVGGPRVDGFTIRAGETINWDPIQFAGGQKAVVHVDNGIYGRMILEVRDQFGNVVVRDNVPGSFYRVEWYPAFTGSYRIRLVNVDTISFICGMATN